MTDPPTFKRIGETADEILKKLEKIHGADDERTTDSTPSDKEAADDAAQPGGRSGSSRFGPV